jgi:hypothetical protein
MSQCTPNKQYDNLKKFKLQSLLRKKKGKKITRAKWQNGKMDWRCGSTGIMLAL